MTTEAPPIVADLRLVEQLFATHTELTDTRHQVTVRDGQVILEVDGSHYEARIWRAAINGRIYPSHIDAKGVRRQLVLGRRIQIQIVERPGPRPSI